MKYSHIGVYECVFNATYLFQSLMNTHIDENTLMNFHKWLSYIFVFVYYHRMHLFLVMKSTFFEFILYCVSINYISYTNLYIMVATRNEQRILVIKRNFSLG